MDKEIISKFKIIIGDKGYDSEENHVIAKRYGLLAIIQEMRMSQYIVLRGKQKKDEKTFARRI